MTDRAPFYPKRRDRRGPRLWAVSHIASAAGASIEMVQQHYCNGENESNRDKLTSAVIVSIPLLAL